MTKAKSNAPNGASTMGTAFHKVSMGLVIAGAAGMFAIGIATYKGAPEHGAGAGTVEGNSGNIVSEQQAALRFAEDPSKTETAALKKPANVTPVDSTGKLWDLFRDIGYEIDGVRTHGEVPRLFLASLPEDLRKLRTVSKKKITFIKSTLPLILHVNELILQDRKRLETLQAQIGAGESLKVADRLWLEELAEAYGAEKPDVAALLARVDIIPPSLAIAQAAEESGWGTSRFAREGNALFGQRSYKPGKKGIVPKEREEGKAFKVRAFDHLIDGVKAYAHNLNSHFAYDDFRNARAEMRAEAGKLDGYRLAGALLRYSERGEDYIDTIRLIMRANTLKVFDGARLGNTVDPDA